MTVFFFASDKPHFKRELEALRDEYSAKVTKLGYKAFDAFGMRQGTEEEIEHNQNFYICDYGVDPISAFVYEKWIIGDPIMQHIGRSSVPFDYVVKLRESKKTAGVLWQLAGLKLSGIERAWCMPMNTVTMVKGVTYYHTNQKNMPDGGAAYFEETRDELLLLGLKFMAAFDAIHQEALEDAAASLAIPDLAENEINCLQWVARGKTNWEIAQILDISENTVRYHLKQSFRKLDVTTRARAVTTALKYGLIDV